MRKYKHSTKFSLSERYQLSENVKSADTLSQLILVITSTEFVSVCLTIIGYKLLQGEGPPLFICRSSYYSLSALQVNIFALEVQNIKGKAKKCKEQ